MQNTNDNKLKKIQQYISKMPSLPTSVAKVVEICDRPTTSPNDLNRVISLDPVLAGQVLKLVNSAYYFMKDQVTSLTRAIIMLGINTVKNLVLCKAIFEIVGKKTSFKVLSMDDFWTHSICVGVTSKLLSAEQGIPITDQEEYFLAGLLHDLGKIPLSNLFPEDYHEVLDSFQKKQALLYNAENLILNINHCEVGGMIGKKWKLNDTINEALSHHHDPDKAGEETRRVVDVVALANFYANHFYNDTLEDSLKEDFKMTTQLQNMDISISFLLDLRETVQIEIANAKAFLQPTQKG